MSKIGAPDAKPTDPEKVQAAINDLKAFQETHSLGGLSVRDMIEEGRRRWPLLVAGEPGA